MIEAKGLSKSYGTVQALKEASFTIQTGEVVGLLGPNGAGKTTLMKVLTGYLHPSAGTALIDGVDVVADPLAVQRTIGYLPENAPLYPDMIVQDYLLMMAELRELPEERRNVMISDAVRRTGLEGYLIRPIGELSKGYRQRVGLAQAILHGPRVLILDEASSGLDPTQIVEIRQLIKRLARNATVLLSTHILTEVEQTCERVLIVSEGELRADARLDELRAANAALASVQGDVSVVRTAFEQIAGVTKVAEVGRRDGYTTFRVTGGGGDLCPTIYDVVHQRGWRLAELRPDQQTLESVFRSIVEGTAVEHTEAAA